MAAINSPPRSGYSMSTTRLQKFRQLNRNRPYRVALFAMYGIFCIYLYTWVVFGTVGNENGGYFSSRNVPISAEIPASAVVDGGGISSSSALMEKDFGEIDLEREVNDRQEQKEEEEEHEDIALSSKPPLDKTTPAEAIQADAIPADAIPENKLSEPNNSESAQPAILMQGRLNLRRANALKTRKRDAAEAARATAHGFLAFSVWLIVCILIKAGTVMFRENGDGTPLLGPNSRLSRSLATNNRTSTRRQQQARFNSLVRRLNRTRMENGERPISAESLRVVISNRDFTGDDYDSLLRFDEENGISSMSLMNSLGATQAEIDRCPSHVITSEDDHLLKKVHRSCADFTVASAGGGEYKSCSICLEQYNVGDHVRRIPCFHTFHVGCIDPW
eukprot:CAMPEP_0195517206 /NCGR_PEP_ID=MMETSP0794_2-20130614/10239_1 /TAXON_ID=515487 /ORGANISM="Stephanopyxis turris, Strain CCMP 815" /LENGTH=389 /DNA_ID=CAMNT_0040645975 /DNA_START=164 /DNA_END=1330 /DNA_ORIENTATION=-